MVPVVSKTGRNCSYRLYRTTHKPPQPQTTVTKQYPTDHLPFVATKLYMAMKCECEYKLLYVGYGVQYPTDHLPFVATILYMAMKCECEYKLLHVGYGVPTLVTTILPSASSPGSHVT
jgi:C4-type Zn-finger protein